MPDADDLVVGCRRLAKGYPIRLGVLTAIPKASKIPSSTSDKINWIQRYFPDLLNNFNVGPYAEDKWKHCKPDDVLIDDKERNIKQWNAAGGRGIHHLSAEQSLHELQLYLKYLF